MRLTQTIRPNPTRAAGRRHGQYGLSLVEMIVALAVGSIVLVITGLLSMYGLTSFLVMGNCAALDDQNRLVADQISRDLREADQVLDYETATDGARLTLTNSAHGIAVEYTWSADTRTLICQKTGQPQSTCLKDCDSWAATFLQNLPQASMSQPFLPATNAMGKLDLDLARIVNLSWKCSRPVAGSKTRTDAAQNLRIVLRNSPQP